MALNLVHQDYFDGALDTRTLILRTDYTTPRLPIKTLESCGQVCYHASKPE
jgi:hypothetical protein